MQSHTSTNRKAAAQPPVTRSESACGTSKHGVPTVAHQSRQTYGPTACKKAAGGCSHAPRKAGTIGPTTCNEAAGGCPHTCEIQDNRTCNMQDTLTQNIRTNNLQVSRVWLPTRPLVSKSAARACNIQLVSSIAATRYLRGLPPGHTAASISLVGTYRQCNHGSVSVPPGSPSGSYSCEHLSSTHATYIH